MLQQPWRFARRPVATRMLVELAAERGVAPEHTLHGTGLTAPELSDPSVALHADQELLAIRNVLRRVGDLPSLGAELGSRFSASNHGDVGFALMTCATGREAVELGVRYVGASDAFVSARAETNALELVVVLETDHLPGDVRPFLVERDVAAIAAITDQIFTGARLGIEVALERERVQELTRVCSEHVVRRGASNRIAIPHEILDVALPSADVTVAKSLERRLAETLRQPAPRAAMSVRVRSALLDSLPRRPAATAVAQRLHVAPRTLRRRLHAEQTSFQTLADDTYAALAKQLLAQDVAVADVADRLGYAETASFTRAFQRWTGDAPSRWRRG